MSKVAPWSSLRSLPLHTLHSHRAAFAAPRVRVFVSRPARRTVACASRLGSRRILLPREQRESGRPASPRVSYGREAHPGGRAIAIVPGASAGRLPRLIAAPGVTTRAYVPERFQRPIRRGAISDLAI